MPKHAPITALAAAAALALAGCSSDGSSHTDGHGSGTMRNATAIKRLAEAIGLIQQADDLCAG